MGTGIATDAAHQSADGTQNMHRKALVLRMGGLLLYLTRIARDARCRCVHIRTGFGRVDDTRDAMRD